MVVGGGVNYFREGAYFRDYGMFNCNIITLNYANVDIIII